MFSSCRNLFTIIEILYIYHSDIIQNRELYVIKITMCIFYEFSMLYLARQPSNITVLIVTYLLFIVYIPVKSTWRRKVKSFSPLMGFILAHNPTTFGPHSSLCIALYQESWMKKFINISRVRKILYYQFRLK